MPTCIATFSPFSSNRVRWACPLYRRSPATQETLQAPGISPLVRRSTPCSRRGSYWIPGSYIPRKGLKHLILNSFFQGCRISRTLRASLEKQSVTSNLTYYDPGIQHEPPSLLCSKAPHLFTSKFPGAAIFEKTKPCLSIFPEETFSWRL
jgi:hypothetical protein